MKQKPLTWWYTNLVAEVEQIAEPAFASTLPLAGFVVAVFHCDAGGPGRDHALEQLPWRRIDLGLRGP